VHLIDQQIVVRGDERRAGGDINDLHVQAGSAAHGASLSTVMTADQISVSDRGDIVGTGITRRTHGGGGSYTELFSIQAARSSIMTTRWKTRKSSARPSAVLGGLI
jgi:hypothetical protein